jgi:hypothetical protein
VHRNIFGKLIDLGMLSSCPNVAYRNVGNLKLISINSPQKIVLKTLVARCVTLVGVDTKTHSPYLVKRFTETCLPQRPGLGVGGLVTLATSYDQPSHKSIGFDAQELLVEFKLKVFVDMCGGEHTPQHVFPGA